MYQGKPSGGIEFYRLLYESQEFCAELGKTTLTSGQLEAELIRLLTRKSVPQKIEGLALGQLIKIAKQNGALDQNMILCLDEVCRQRNYLTHNIYALFAELIVEKGLARTDLLDSDIHTYIELVWQLKENLIGLAAIIRDT